MPTVKCDNCGHSVEVEDATKKYRLPLFFIFLGLAVVVFQHIASNPSLIIAILGGLSATSGLVWLVVTRVVSNRDCKEVFPLDFGSCLSIINLRVDTIYKFSCHTEMHYHIDGYAFIN